MLIKAVLGPALQHVRQALGIGGGDEDVGDAVLDAELGGGAEDVVGLDHQVADDFGFFAADEEVVFFSEIGQGDVEPPAFVVAVADDLGELGIAIVEDVGLQGFVGDLYGFGFVHCFLLLVYGWGSVIKLLLGLRWKPIPIPAFPLKGKEFQAVIVNA